MLYWHFIHIYVLHMSNVHQYIWWQVGVRFLRELDHLHILCIWRDLWIWRKIWQISLLIICERFLEKLSLRELKKKVYKLAKIFSVWPDAVPGGWSNRLGSWNWQQNSFWESLFSLSPVWQLNRHPDWPAQSKEMQSVTAMTDISVQKK